MDFLSKNAKFVFLVHGSYKRKSYLITMMHLVHDILVLIRLYNLVEGHFGGLDWPRMLNNMS